MTISHMLYSVRDMVGAEELNALIYVAFTDLMHDASNRQSHFFKGRFENIYLPIDKLPEVATILDYSEQSAREILNIPDAPLRTGFWFNYMQPGDTTTLHRHDDDDELLSAVYYLRVPPDSGDLILHPVTGVERVIPKEGRLILFPPSVPHEVSENRSAEARLSIGMNIGPDYRWFNHPLV